MIVLRRARPEDAATIAGILIAARGSAMPYLPRLYTDQQILAWVRSRVLTECEVWAAEEDGRVCGFAAVGPGWLHHLYVAPGALRRGVGTLLLEKAKQRSPAGLRLYVFQRNAAARAFYASRGFCLVALGDGSGNEESEPDALYEWRGLSRDLPARPSSETP